MARPMFHIGAVDPDRVIYTPSAFARSSLLHLQEAGTLHATSPHTSRRKGLSSSLFFLVRSGSGTLTLDGTVWPLHAGDCVFINCMRAYAHAPAPDDLWSLQWIHFDGPSMPLVHAKYVERGGKPVFTPASPEAFSDLVTQVCTLAASDDHIRDMRINEKIAGLLTLIMAESWHPDTARAGLKKQSMQDVRAYLDEHYAERITLDSLAGTFFISKYYLTHAFRAQYGMTILSYLDHVRVSRAKQLLRFSDMTAEAVGAAVGIPDPAYFSRLFKKVEGAAPGEYRKLW